MTAEGLSLALLRFVLYLRCKDTGLEWAVTLCTLPMLGTEARALCILGKCSTTEPKPLALLRWVSSYSFATN